MRKETHCPVNKLLDIMSAKWTTEVLRELSIGPTRTRRFLAVIPGLTMKSLRQRLQELEDNGFVIRHQLSTRPPKVEYTITDKGRKLAQLLAHVKVVAEDINGDGNGMLSCNCPLTPGVEKDFNCPERRPSVLPATTQVAPS